MNTPFSAQSPLSSFGQMPDFARLVPGFDFLQNLVKGSGAQVPGIGQWVVPTLDPEELTRRIDELRTVQFWLEQNARMIGTTIQALEVQRMTLTTLKGMNVAASDLADALKIKVPEPQAAAPAAAAAPQAATTSAEAAGEGAAAGAGGADPMLWWNSLTQQFGEIASRTVQSIQEAAATAAAAVPEPVVKPAAKRGKTAAPSAQKTAAPQPAPKSTPVKKAAATKTAAAARRKAG